ncbi:MAG: hypothetical protein ACD_16C00165G0004 [uncultured bacterium]|nr:MAG: hypothetical protein ACD_16C00165G0004 [uncultured bacterium]
MGGVTIAFARIDAASATVFIELATVLASPESIHHFAKDSNRTFSI